MLQPSWAIGFALGRLEWRKADQPSFQPLCNSPGPCQAMTGSIPSQTIWLVDIEGVLQPPGRKLLHFHLVGNLDSLDPLPSRSQTATN